MGGRGLLEARFVLDVYLRVVVRGLFILLLIGRLSSVATSTRPDSLRPGPTPGGLVNLEPQRYVVYSTPDQIWRVNLEEESDVVEVSRPDAANMHLDYTNMMVYFSAFGGEKIMKQPLNFGAQGSPVTVVDELEGVAGIAFHSTVKTLYWITADGQLVGIGFYTGLMEVLETGLRNPRFLKIDM